MLMSFNITLGIPIAASVVLVRFSKGVHSELAVDCTDVGVSVLFCESSEEPQIDTVITYE